MNKKVLLSLALAGILAFGAGMGTIAYFTETWTSSENVFETAEFNLTAEGIDEGNFSIERFAPGHTSNHIFKIRKQQTNVPYNYEVKVKLDNLNGIEVANHPFEFGLIIDEESITGTIDPSDKSISFIVEPGDASMTQGNLVVNWPWGDGSGTDNSWAGKELDFTVTVTANQKQENVHHTTIYVSNKSGNVQGRHYVPVTVTFGENDEVLNITGSGASYNANSKVLTIDFNGSIYTYDYNANGSTSSYIQYKNGQNDAQVQLPKL